jgi:N-acetylmuramoyl-L-alanine amidase
MLIRIFSFIKLKRLQRYRAFLKSIDVSSSIYILLLSILLLSGCVTAPVQNTLQNPLAEWSPSVNFDARKPRLIVIHATEMNNAESALLVLKSQNSAGRVSAHYLIADDGKIFQLVEDQQRAWHAGAGRWRGVNDLNSISIGIELDNDGIEAFQPQQIQALIKLLDDLCLRWDIPRTAIIGHADLAPARKSDPSAKFPWQELAQAGFGYWFSDSLNEVPAGFDAVLALRAFGYDTRDLPAAVTAFKRRFRGAEGNELDAFDAKILYSLLQQ